MSKFENVGQELSDLELSAVQGGGPFSFIGKAVSAVGNAIADGAKAVGNAIAQGAQAVAEGLANVFIADAKRRLRGYGY